MPLYRATGDRVELDTGQVLYPNVAGRDEGTASASQRHTDLVTAGSMVIVDPDADPPASLPVRDELYRRRDNGTIEVSLGGGVFDSLGSVVTADDVAGLVADFAAIPSAVAQTMPTQPWALREVVEIPAEVLYLSAGDAVARAGVPIRKVTAIAAKTLDTPTAYWMELRRADTRELLAQSQDHGSDGWAAETPKEFVLPEDFVPDEAFRLAFAFVHVSAGTMELLGSAQPVGGAVHTGVWDGGVSTSGVTMQTGGAGASPLIGDVVETPGPVFLAWAEGPEA